ncbi:hypothetical protein FACS189459_1800 [Bacilli bacterium]|nr:hypothetical protein FACS189459_1800 [Bacilli bacterium]
MHAEANSLINAMNHNQGNINGCKVYVTLFPCNECAKLLVQAGIKEIVYYDDKYHNLDVYVVSRKIFDNAGIKYTQYVKTNREIKISL